MINDRKIDSFSYLVLTLIIVSITVLFTGDDFVLGKEKNGEYIQRGSYTSTDLDDDTLTEDKVDNISEPNPGVIDNPGEGTNVTIDSDVRFDLNKIFNISLFIVFTLVISIFVVMFFKRREVSRVEMEMDDDWINEDWVDLDIDISDDKLRNGRF